MQKKADLQRSVPSNPRTPSHRRLSCALSHSSVVLFSLPASVIAHDVVKGPNGGQVVNDQGHQVEFTVKGDQIALYFTDNRNQPIATKSATGRVSVQDSAKQSTSSLRQPSQAT